jgi:hypothetical protein
MPHEQEVDWVVHYVRILFNHTLYTVKRTVTACYIFAMQQTITPIKYVVDREPIIPARAFRSVGG